MRVSPPRPHYVLCVCWMYCGCCGPCHIIRHISKPRVYACIPSHSGCSTPCLWAVGTGPTDTSPCPRPPPPLPPVPAASAASLRLTGTQWRPPQRLSTSGMPHRAWASRLPPTSGTPRRGQAAAAAAGGTPPPQQQQKAAAAAGGMPRQQQQAAAPGATAGTPRPR